MTAPLDARTLPDGQALTPDLAIIGGGPAGISLALALAGTGLNILLLESGGENFDSQNQKLYAGGETGRGYTALDAGRLRFLGGSTNHWGGWCRPLDAIDFARRDGMPYSGWPFAQSALAPFYPRAQALVEAGTWIYDKGDQAFAAQGGVIPLGDGGIYTSWFQFSKTRDSELPTYFGHRYGDDLKRAARVKVLLHANVTGIRLAQNAQSVARLDVATLTGKKFTVTPRVTVLACGGMENARLLLASNDVMAAGVGNQNDLVGRFFGDNPIPRDTAQLVNFAGALPAHYGNNITLPDGGPIMQAAFAPNTAFRRRENLLGSLTTVEQPVELDEMGKAAVITTAIALGVDASNAKTYALGCGLELMPDPERRLTLSGEKDALGMPRLTLHMTMAEQDFAHYDATLRELGRQLLAAKSGMLRIMPHESWSKNMDWGNHHLGTTRMSADARTGVVDADQKVHGISNLYVAGSSVFATYGASNPTLNLVALTLRLGEHLKKVMA